MPALVPRPVPADVSLAVAMARAPDSSPLGVWLVSRRPFRVSGAAAGHRRVCLIDADLGRLLRHCRWILVRIGACISVMSADELGRQRSLRVVAELPCACERLPALFPDARLARFEARVPLAYRSAEEVLAACAAVRIAVLFSDVVYG